jgi:trk system potassium uptake protein TrkA
LIKIVNHSVDSDQISLVAPLRVVGFDRDTLLEAGIAEAGAFAAVSNGDNSNILAARVARETYGVENVVARIYDRRSCRNLSTAWNSRQWPQFFGPPIRSFVDSFRKVPAPNGEMQVASSNSAKFTSRHLGTERPASIIEERTAARLAFITRLGEGLNPRRKDRSSRRRSCARDGL